MAVALALAAALLFAIATVLQQRVAVTASDDEAVSAGFLLQLARHPMWLAGIAVDAVGFLCQAAALAVGRIAVVQPILASMVVFVLPIGARYSGQKVGRRQFAGAAAVMIGLAVFLVVGDPSGGRSDAPMGPWLVAGGVTLGISAVLFVVGQGQRPRVKATMFGLAAGILFGLSAALTKSTVDQLGDGFFQIFTHWHVYALLFVGWASMTLSEASLQTGELAPAVATSATMDPIVSLVLGVTLLQESVTDDTVGLIASVIALAVMVAGIVILAAAEQPPVIPEKAMSVEVAPA